MKLVIDIGNTFVKTAVYDETQMLELTKCSDLSVHSLEKLLNKYKAINAAILSSVRETASELELYLQKKLILIELDRYTPLPFSKLYKTPETLGKDRLAAVAGALSLFPAQNVLVVDAGTCITYDMLTSDKEHLGGGISPGLQMRFDALHTLTSQLPLVKAITNNEVELIGNTTQSSILSGVQNGILQEVDGVIEQYKADFSKLKIVLGGGDNKYFDKYLKNNIFAAPNLVLHGLMKILQFNENI